MKKFVLLSAIALGLGFTSCDKQEPAGQVALKFNYVWGQSVTDPFELNVPLYHPMSFDTLEYTTFKHYVSHIELLNANGEVVPVGDTYYLLNAANEANSMNFSEVPAGNYYAIRLTFGVDSAANVSGAQTGALDPINEMFWSWTQGYIMIKAEGTSPQAANGTFAYHLGGFSGDVNTVSTRTINFTEPIKVSSETSPTVVLLANPARLFHTYGSVSNGATIHMPMESAAQMAEDFNSWVRFGGIE